MAAEDKDAPLKAAPIVPGSGALHSFAEVEARMRADEQAQVSAEAAKKLAAPQPRFGRYLVDAGTENERVVNAFGQTLNDKNEPVDAQGRRVPLVDASGVPVFPGQ